MNADTIMMKDGRVMRMRNGEMAPIEEEVTMPDGTRILLDGTVLMTNGVTRVMAEGETMYVVNSSADTPTLPEMGSTEDMTSTESHDPT